MRNQQWLSAHLFYYDDPVPLLVDCVHPLTEELRASQAIQCFFFIRYWQGGPHIRLRLLCADASLRETITSVLEARVKAFFTSQPSKTFIRQEDYSSQRAARSKIEFAQEDQTPLYPNNSLQYIPYAPEYERYGGVEAMPLIEHYFMESSEIVLELLQAKLSHNRLTSKALIMMFLGLWLWENELTCLSEIFERYYRGWISSFSTDRSHNPKQFEKQYNRQRQKLQELVKMLLPLKQQQHYVPDDPLIARWISIIHTLKEQLYQLEAGDNLYPNRSTDPMGYPERHPLQSIILSCLHMHNNRLGISTLEEAYISFLLWQILTEMVADRSQEE